VAKNLAFTAGGYFPGSARTERKPTYFQRGASWLAGLRTSRNEAAIEQFINEHGGVLTDSVEREIAKRFIDPAPGRF
jgi:hypothetical protein